MAHGGHVGFSPHVDVDAGSIGPCDAQAGRGTCWPLPNVSDAYKSRFQDADKSRFQDADKSRFQDVPGYCARREDGAQ